MGCVICIYSPTIQSQIPTTFKMDEQMQLLFTKLKQEMDKQTSTLKESITKTILEEMDIKLKPIIEENRYLKDEVKQLNEKVKLLELRKKENNVIFYGFEEKTENINIVDMVSKTLINSGIEIRKEDINKAFRIGKVKGVTRPILVNMVNAWKRDEILRKKKTLPKNIYVKEDFSKEVLEKRRELVSQLKEERRKGRIAYIKYDKLVVKDEAGMSRDKRKREESSSPVTPKDTGNALPKINKINAFERMYKKKNRSQSTSDIHKE